MSHCIYHAFVLHKYNSLFVDIVGSCSFVKYTNTSSTNPKVNMVSLLFELTENPSQINLDSFCTY